MCRREVPPLLVRTPRFAALQQAAPIRLRVVLPLRARIVQPVRLHRFRAARQARPVPLLPPLQHAGHGRGLGSCYGLLKPSRTGFCAVIKSCGSFGMEFFVGEGNVVLFGKMRVGIWLAMESVFCESKIEKDYAYNQIWGACQIHGICCPLFPGLRSYSGSD